MKMKVQNVDVSQERCVDVLNVYIQVAMFSHGDVGMADWECLGSRGRNFLSSQDQSRSHMLRVPTMRALGTRVGLKQAID